MKKIAKKAPVVGFVRYSQRVTFGISDKEKDMFDADYFDYRFDIFRRITLRSLQQQTDANFILVLLHSVSMPSQCRDRLIELENTNSFLYNIFINDTKDSWMEALKTSAKYVSFENNVAITFRIDNDDAVQTDFIRQLGKFLDSSYVGFAISMPHLCISRRISDASFMVEERNYPSNSIGLAYVTSRNKYETVMELGDHRYIYKDTPIVHLAGDATGGLMTINGENAANRMRSSNVKFFTAEEVDNYLSARGFDGLDLDCLRIVPLESKNSSLLILKQILKSLVPPFLISMLHKLKYSR
jgi:hypothetical protein